MKEYLWLSFLLILFSSACKKDEKTPKPFDEALISTTWLTTGEKYEYFDASGTKVFEQTQTPGVKYVFRDSTKTVTITDLAGNRVKKTYALSNINGKIYLTLNSNAAIDTFEITEYTDKTMSWHQEKSNQQYEDNGTKVAAKKVVSMNFHCPCRD